MSINDRNIDIKELKKGIQMIIKAFNEQKEQYLKIINSMKEKIALLEEQITKLTEENNRYQNKLFSLQQNIKYISKTICQIKDDEESIEDKDNNDVDKSNSSNSIDQEQNLKIKLIKNKNKDFFKKYSLNKLEIKKPIKSINQESNINFEDEEEEDNNYYIRDDDIQIKRKEKKDNNYMNNIYKTLNIKKSNIKETESIFNSNSNEDKTDYVRNEESKKEKEIKDNLNDSNNNSNQDK